MAACTALVLLLPTVATGATRNPTVEDLGRLSLEELGNIEVTSVSKRAQPLSQAPAAIYVITDEDIRRSGAVSLPEALRLAPNLQVSRLSASNYAVTARGFGGNAAATNKMLVLIDGRTVYTPLHGGVFWDQQHVVLEDIDRIEVISGPGGTLWGANAVNGVINVITKNSRGTQGGLVSGYYGNVDSGGAARYGGRLGEDGAWRAYGLGFDRGHTVTPAGNSRRDDWHRQQVGFRTDWAGGRDDFTVQGDLFENFPDPGGAARGQNLLARWGRDLGDRSTLTVKGYYDRVRIETPTAGDSLETLDIEAQHEIALGQRHQLVWGGGTRYIERAFRTTGTTTLSPLEDEIVQANGFVQDTIELAEAWHLTLGTKIEYSSWSGTEYMPSARLGWLVGPTDLLWAAVSRAARTPTHLDRGVVGPTLLQAPDFGAEELTAWELGWRGQPDERSSLAVTVYWHDYDDLRASVETGTAGVFRLGNAISGEVVGTEAWGSYALNDWWRLSAGLNVMSKNLERAAGATESSIDSHIGNDPSYQFQVRSSMNLANNMELDLGLRAVDHLPRPSVPGYISLDARLGWHASESVELWVAGSNLLDEHHPEAGTAAARSEARRSAMLGGRWRF